MCCAYNFVFKISTLQRTLCGIELCIGRNCSRIQVSMNFVSSMFYFFTVKHWTFLSWIWTERINFEPFCVKLIKYIYCITRFAHNLDFIEHPSKQFNLGLTFWHVGLVSSFWEAVYFRELRTNFRQTFLHLEDKIN